MHFVILFINIFCAIWVISNIVKRKDKTSEQRLLWIILSIIPTIGIVTAIVYFLFEYNKQNNNTNINKNGF